MTNEERYWKAEYECLRRKKNREIETLRYQIARFVGKTYKLLEGMGLSSEVIHEYYRSVI